MLYPTIALSGSIRNWEMVEIVDNHERMVSLQTLQHKRIQVIPKLHLLGVPQALSDVWVRECVAERLVKALDNLNPHDSFVVWDGWRPLAVQEAMYQLYFEKFKRDFPFLKEDEVHRYTRMYVTSPSTNPSCPYPHITGGSIDITIGNSDRNTLFMGTSYMHISEKNKTRYYEIHPSTKQNEKIALENRRYLVEVMNQAGFTNYEEAWWHYDYGNQWWAIKKKKHAVYGLTEL